MRRVCLYQAWVFLEYAFHLISMAKQAGPMPGPIQVTEFPLHLLGVCEARFGQIGPWGRRLTKLSRHTALRDADLDTTIILLT